MNINIRKKGNNIATNRWLHPQNKIKVDDPLILRGDYIRENIWITYWQLMDFTDNRLLQRIIDH